MRTDSIIKSQELNIGSVKLASRVVLAPMAGITDTVLRQLVRRFSNKSLLASEMISSEALRMNGEHKVTDYDQIEKPLSFQLSGHKPQFMAESAKKIEEMATIIDINMGCPAPKIVSNFDGVKLMTDPILASDIIKAVKNAVNVPVTVKFRLGWDNNSKNYLEFAKMTEESGADAITVHGRTRSQMYSGQADWHAIGQIKQAVKIPVIGNGDITSPEKAKECLKISKCDGIMVGRAIFGDPGLIDRIEQYIETGIMPAEPTLEEKLEIALLHSRLEASYREEIHGMKFMRKFFGHYIKGIRNAARYRERLVKVESISDLEKIFEEIRVQHLQEC